MILSVQIRVHKEAVAWHAHCRKRFSLLNFHGILITQQTIATSLCLKICPGGMLKPILYSEE